MVNLKISVTAICVALVCAACVSRVSAAGPIDICRENSAEYFGAYRLSAEIAGLPDAIVAQQAEFMEQVVAHNQQSSFGTWTRKTHDPGGERWETHGVAHLTARTDRLASIREEWLVFAFGSPGHSMNGKIYDLETGNALNTEEIMADKKAASTAITAYGNALSDAFRAGEVTLPITLNYPVERRFRLAPRWPHSEGWLVPARDNPGKIGGIAFDERSGGVFEPYSYVFVVPQSVIRDYLDPAYLDQFDGEPAGPIISPWPSEPNLLDHVEKENWSCEPRPE